MALYGVGKTKIDVMCGKASGAVHRMAVVGDLTLTRSVNAASTMTFTARRSEITPELGEVVTLTVDEQHDMFWGYITSVKKHSKTVDITAQDQIRYLRENTYTQNYGTLKASELIVRMADDFGFAMVDPPTVADTEYPIPNVILQGAKPLDVIIDALNITFRNTGKRYYVFDAYHNLCLDWDENPETLKVTTFEVTHFNIRDYSYNEELGDLRNIVKVTTKKTETAEEKTYVAQDAGSVARYGKLELTQEVDDKENPQAVADELLKENSGHDKTLSVTGAVGDPRIMGGSSIHVDLYTNGLEDQREFIMGWFKVENVTHKFSIGTHTMDMELTEIEMEAFDG